MTVSGLFNCCVTLPAKLPEAGEPFRVDELFKEHGLTARGLEAGSEQFDGQKIFGAGHVGSADRSTPVFGTHPLEQQGAVGAGAAHHRNGQNGSEVKTLKVVAGKQPGREIEAHGFAVLDGGRRRTWGQKSVKRDAGREFAERLGDGDVKACAPASR